MPKTSTSLKRNAPNGITQNIEQDSKLAEKEARYSPGMQVDIATLLAIAENALLDIPELEQLTGLKDIHLWTTEKTKTTKNGIKTYAYWMASWHESSKVRKVYLGSSRKMDAEAALKKAQKLKLRQWGITEDVQKR